MATARSVAFIQGASRGIGLEFCRQILKTRPHSAVVATCRKPADATELNSLRLMYGERLDIYELDVTQPDQIIASADEVEAKYGALDLLINCAGILHPSGRGETTLRDVNLEGLQATMAVNALGPLIMAKHFAPLLQKGSGSFGAKCSDAGPHHRAVIVNMSAKVGSISDNGLGGWYSYRLSKAAVNMATKNLSVEFGRGSKRILSISLHPGTVDTELSRPYQKNVHSDRLFTTEHSVKCLLAVIDGLTTAHTGKFFSWDGSELPY